MDVYVLTPGIRDKDVLTAQKMLHLLGYYNRKVYGKRYGKYTQDAVRRFKIDHKLNHDHILGRKAWRALERAVAKKQHRPARKLTVTRKQPQPIPAKGIDTSGHQQGRVSFAAARKDGVRFVWCKSSEGDWNDPLFFADVRRAKAAGLKVGGYQFLVPRPGRTGAREVEHFIARLRQAGLGKGDLRPVLDIEHIHPTTHRPLLGVHEMRVYIASAVKKMRAAGYDPIIYTGAWWWNPYVGAMTFGCDLWVSDYSGDVQLPAGFHSYVAHQHTSSGRQTWYPGLLDLNRTSDLRKLVA